ncbi:hypothetical protein FAM19022_000880 [Propionibacterium freudenreichii]|uniref:hypothetical protein n=1 Tax=Propionibacterium freudenreichii TaxID=1744 RepID=UPI00254F5689|nr:hypothetical protein [Propionibacterium freudenreichii]MDK9646119.1 hypothetical protein [Propionibacterium freudenreichii]
MVLAVLGVATIAWQLSPAGEWLRHWVRTGGGTAHIGGASNVARGLVMLVDPGSIGATVALLVLMVSVFPYIERRLGAWRFVAALVCCHVVATGLTLGFASLIASQWPRWSDALVNGWSNGAIPALLGVAMAASGGVQPPVACPHAMDRSGDHPHPGLLRHLDLRCHDPRIDGRRPGHRRLLVARRRTLRPVAALS